VILHRDARCVVVDKPSGLSTHRGWDDSDDALLQRVRDAVAARPLIHRLTAAPGLVLLRSTPTPPRSLAAWSDATSATWPSRAATHPAPPDRPPILARPASARAARTEIWRRDTTAAPASSKRPPAVSTRSPPPAHQLPADRRRALRQGEHNRIFRTEHGLPPRAALLPPRDHHLAVRSAWASPLAATSRGYRELPFALPGSPRHPKVRCGGMSGIGLETSGIVSSTRAVSCAIPSTDIVHQVQLLARKPGAERTATASRTRRRLPNQPVPGYDAFVSVVALRRWGTAQPRRGAVFRRRGPSRGRAGASLTPRSPRTPSCLRRQRFGTSTSDQLLSGSRCR
jgi:hypothetical protein